LAKVISDGDVRAEISTGGRVENVIVIALRDALGRPNYALYFTPSWRRGYLAIGLWTGKGIRTWRDLTRLMSFVRDDLIYPGAVTIYEQDDPKLRRIKSLAPEG
jgi:hypothetical protein